MKKIAFTQRLVDNQSYFEIRDCLDLNWAAFCQALNCLPILLPTSIELSSKYFEEIGIDGLVLTGGNDLFEVNKSDLSHRRDSFEFKLLEIALGRRLPVIGVCRGMQVINSFFGGEIAPVQSHVGREHSLKVNADSKLASKLAKLGKVNSFHNYAAANAPEAFTVSATADDNVIEAFEHKELPIFAQMWHPERVMPIRNTDLEIFEELFA